MKQHKKLFLLFLLTLCLSGFIAPVIKVILDTLTSSSSFMADLLNYKHGSYDFGRVMRRIMMAMAILLIFLMRKQLMIGSFVALGIKPVQGWWEQLQMGFFLSTGMFILYIIFLWICGTQIFQPDAKSPTEMIFQLLKILLIAGLWDVSKKYYSGDLSFKVCWRTYRPYPLFVSAVYFIPYYTSLR